MSVSVGGICSRREGKVVECKLSLYSDEEQAVGSCRSAVDGVWK